MASIGSRSSSNNEGQALEGLPLLYSYLLSSKCNDDARALSSALWSRVENLPAPASGPGPRNVKLVADPLPLPSNVNILTTVSGPTFPTGELGVQVKMKVSWEDGEPAFGSDTGAELWVRVLSTRPMETSNVLPEEVSSQIAPEALAGYNHRACHWYGDLRQDDDETVIEWPYEQWWALPRMRTYT